MWVYRRSGRDILRRAAAALAIVCGLGFAVWQLYRMTPPLERETLAEVQGTFAELRHFSGYTRRRLFSGHCELYLKEYPKPYTILDRVGFDWQNFPAQPGDSVTLLCIGTEPPAQVYGVWVAGKEVLSYEHAVWAERFSARVGLSSLVALAALLLLQWLWRSRYTEKQPEPRRYRGRRFGRR